MCVDVFEGVFEYGVISGFFFFLVEKFIKFIVKFVKYFKIEEGWCSVCCLKEKIIVIIMLLDYGCNIVKSSCFKLL